MVPTEFSWFQVGFSWFQVSFHGLWFFIVPDGFSWLQVGFYGSRLVSWIFIGVFMVPGRFFMIPGWFLWF